MSENNIIEKIKDINSLIRRKVMMRRLKSALTALRSSKIVEGDSDLSSRLRMLEETYKGLLRYFIAGVDDPNREEYVNSISNKILELSDAVERKSLKPMVYDIYFKNLRNLDTLAHESRDIKLIVERLSAQSKEITENAGNSIATSPEMRKDYEENLSLLFNVLFGNHILSDRDYRILAEILTDQDLRDEISLQIATALTLSNIHYYDPKKANLLLTAYFDSNDVKLRVRAITGILLTVIAQSDRIKLDKDLNNRIDYLANESDLKRDLQTIVEAYIRSTDTDRVNKKMKDEILPEIKKMQSKLSDKFKNIADLSDPESIGSDMNPEWEKMLSETGLDKKLQSMNDMQEEGSDVMMLAFANLKNYPFFRLTSNWFLPYSADHSAVAGSGKQVISELMESLPEICDSDKYSFILTAANMPKPQLSAMIDQLSGHMESIKDLHNSSLPKSEKEKFAAAATSYVRNLYRFFKLHPQHRELPNSIFSTGTNFFELPAIGRLTASQDFLTLVAEFYLKREYFGEAASMFAMIAESGNNASAGTFEKLGYALERSKRMEEALDAYRKAELLEADNDWLMRSIGRVLKSLERYDEAAEYYEKGMVNGNESISSLINLGNMLLFANKPEKALPWFYKANYLDPKGLKGLRAISWCEFLIGNYEKSERHLRTIMAENPLASDYLNLAHIKISTGKLKDAVESYVRSIRTFENELADFNSSFKEDLIVLRSKGISEESLNLVMDQVLYDLDS